MTIDERLEKLVERHQALLEKLQSMAREREEKKSGVRGFKSGTDGFRVSAHEIAEGASRLLHIAQIREQRIIGIEG